jgi:hypothetical protein
MTGNRCKSQIAISVGVENNEKKNEEVKMGIWINYRYIVR